MVASSRGEATENGSSAGSRKKNADLQLTAFAYNEEIYLRTPTATPKYGHLIDSETPEMDIFNETKVMAIRLSCKTRNFECFFCSEDTKYEINARLLVDVHQPSPSWARVIAGGKEIRRAAFYTHKDAVFLRDSAEAAALLRIPRLSPREKTKAEDASETKSLFLSIPPPRNENNVFQDFQK